MKRNLRVKVADIAEGTTEHAVRDILSQGGILAAQKTPIDTSTLVNSQYAPQIDVTEGKVTGSIGYIAEYAQHVHDAPGSMRGRPRDPEDPSRGDFWDPNAEPGFLAKGFEEIKPAIPAILKRHYKV